MKVHSWSLWLDDQISDVATPSRWAPKGFVAVDSVAEAKDKFKLFGYPPETVSLDHDLGEGNPDGLDFLRWWADNYYNTPPRVCRIHSANPVGAENMRSYLQSWRKSLES